MKVLAVLLPLEALLLGSQIATFSLSSRGHSSGSTALVALLIRRTPVILDVGPTPTDLILT